MRETLPDILPPVSRPEFLWRTDLKCRRKEKIDYAGMTSEWHPYRTWCNPPRRNRFAAFRIDGEGRDYKGSDRIIIVIWKWPEINIKCENPPKKLECIHFQTIDAERAYLFLPRGPCEEALRKLPTT